jgi:hypothetical protein
VPPKTLVVRATKNPLRPRYKFLTRPDAVSGEYRGKTVSRKEFFARVFCAAILWDYQSFFTEKLSASPTVATVAACLSFSRKIQHQKLDAAG